VAFAYLDQLVRSKSIELQRARSVADALARADKMRSRRDRGAPAVVAELDSVSGQLERDADAASGRDAVRLRSLAATIKGSIARLR
jgi:hypothetical protein